MRRKYEEIEVSFISNAKYHGWTRCAKCGDEVCKEPMFFVRSKVLWFRSSNVEVHYCIECAPNKQAARELFDKTYINPPPPPPPRPKNITVNEWEVVKLPNHE